MPANIFTVLTDLEGSISDCKSVQLESACVNMSRKSTLDIVNECDE
jgi:hypothetical protein